MSAVDVVATIVAKPGRGDVVAGVLADALGERSRPEAVSLVRV